MSIIYDALKKVGTSGPAGVSLKAQENKKNKNKISLYLVYLIVAGVGFFLANMIFNLLSPITTQPQKKEIAALAAKPAMIESTPMQTAPETKKPDIPRASFALNGVFYSEDQAYALINNQIVKVGDEIGGAVVKKITEDSVELEAAGTNINLATTK